MAPDAAEAILGQRVTDPEGKDIGRLVDVLVDANGQPFPGPFRFWIVTDAAVILADLSCFESPVGKETLTEGLLTANPAWTFLIKA